jgi:hypothetical protein
MARSHLAAAAALAALALAGCSAASTPPQAPSPSTPASSSPSPSPSAAPSCDASLWGHVYHPDRLKVVEQCKTVSGTVEAVRFEPDGDTHIRLRTDASLVNAANVQYQHVDLVLEEICQGPVTQADAVQACQGAPHVLVPAVGDEVAVTGSYVLDQVHGWMEIHPVTSLTVTGHA